MRDLVEPDAAYAGNLGIDPRVVMSEEANAGRHARQHRIQPLRLAHEFAAAVVTGKAHAGRG